MFFNNIKTTLYYRYFRPTWDSRLSLSCEEKKKKKYNHFKTFLKHLTQHTIDFVMKKHDIFDKTLMKTFVVVVELSSASHWHTLYTYIYKIIQYTVQSTQYYNIYINIHKYSNKKKTQSH